MKHGLFSANELRQHFDIDKKTLQNWLDAHQIEPLKVEETATDDRKYYGLKQFWPFLKEFSGESSESGSISTVTKEQLDKEIAFEKPRKDKRENDLAEGLLAPIDEVVQLGAPILEQAGKLLDRLGEQCREIVPSMDEKDVDDINEKVAVPVKNSLASLLEKIQANFG